MEQWAVGAGAVLASAVELGWPVLAAIWWFVWIRTRQRPMLYVAAALTGRAAGVLVAPFFTWLSLHDQAHGEGVGTLAAGAAGSWWSLKLSLLQAGADLIYWWGFMLAVLWWMKGQSGRLKSFIVAVGLVLTAAHAILLPLLWGSHRFGLFDALLLRIYTLTLLLHVPLWASLAAAAWQSRRAGGSRMLVWVMAAAVATGLLHLMRSGAVATVGMEAELVAIFVPFLAAACLAAWFGAVWSEGARIGAGQRLNEAAGG